MYIVLVCKTHQLISIINSYIHTHMYTLTVLACNTQLLILICTLNTAWFYILSYSCICFLQPQDCWTDCWHWHWSKRSVQNSRHDWCAIQTMHCKCHERFSAQSGNWSAEPSCSNFNNYSNFKLLNKSPFLRSGLTSSSCYWHYYNYCCCCCWCAMGSTVLIVLTLSLLVQLVLAVVCWCNTEHNTTHKHQAHTVVHVTVAAATDNSSCSCGVVVSSNLSAHPRELWCAYRVGIR
jgi:hypothetical protein